MAGSKFSLNLVLILLFAATTAAAAVSPEYKQGEVIVKYKNGVVRTRTSMNALYDAAGVKNVRRFDAPMVRMERLVLRDGVQVPDAIATLRHDPSVEYAQPNYILRIPEVALRSPLRDRLPPDPEPSATPTPDTRPALAPPPGDVEPPVADPSLSQVWGLSKIGATDAWAQFRGSKDFIVADIDTGIDYNHEDLAFNVWRNPNPGPKNDVVGYDFIHDDGLPFDDNEHGTHTAGTIGAVGGNGIGISGVAQRVSIMAVKFLDSSGSGTTADAVSAIGYAVSHGAKVLNNSWGGSGDSTNSALLDAVNQAQAAGVLFVAAAGNDGVSDDDPTNASYPAAFNTDNMIAVAASDDTDALAFFSNFGPTTVHLSAPGTNVYSTVPGNKYEELDGTSMACPHVVGAAALVWAAHPDWDYKKVKAVLLSSVDKVDGMSGKTVTGGRLNVLNALRSTE